MIFFVRFSSSTAISIWQPKNARQTLGDKLVCISNLQYYLVNSPCGVPGTAQAYVLNATVVPTGGLGYLTLWPDGEPKPLVSTLNALDGSITNNMAIVPSTNGKVDAYASGITQLILDISSYFAP